MQLVTHRRTHPYFAVKHFKGRDNHGSIRYRDTFLPGANEALAESYLLGECSKYASFKNPSNVFSYALSGPDDVGGIFQNYMVGVTDRQKWIAAACRRFSNPVVQYTDVREFYPSIRPETALHVWTSVCSKSSVPSHLRRLGERLIESHVAFGKKILTGPMFSHLLGNLVLRSLDDLMSGLREVAYCRYVDDVTLVGSKKAVGDARARVEEHLARLDLKLHPPDSGKDLVVQGRDWLRGEHDYVEHRQSIDWKTFVGGLKWCVTAGQERHVQDAILSAGFRLPVRGYSGAVREKAYVERLKRLVPLRWFRKKRRSLDELLREGHLLRERYLQEAEQHLTVTQQVQGFERKRLLPKLRYCAGRLAYLAAPDQLANLAEELAKVEELEFHAVVLKAIATGDVTEPLRLGANVVQAVAQPLHAEGRQATVQGPIDGPVETHGLAVLALNGVKVSGAGIGPHDRNEFLRLAHNGADIELMRSSDPFVREIACLHGVGSPRHSEVLDSAFDPAEDTAFDALSQTMYQGSGA